MTRRSWSTAKIPLSKPWVGPEEREAVLRVLDSGMLVQGSEVRALEGEWADACGAKYAIATSSGTTALEVALRAHGVGPGHEVITTPFTFIATVNAILHVGATPVFVDIEPATFNLDANHVERALTPKTKAIVPVQLFGQPCDLDAIASIASRASAANARDVVVIEDAAQAMGATFRDRPIGSFSTTCFSLYATKNVMAGEGGMITTADEYVARRCRLLRSHGREGKEEPLMLGFNYRMSELHAALGRAQLRRLSAFTAKRREHAAYLSSQLRAVVTPETVRDHVWHQYTVRVRGGRDERDRGERALFERGIGTGVFYRTPAHRFEHVRAASRCAMPLANAERAADEVLSLPVHPLLAADDLETLATAVNQTFA